MSAIAPGSIVPEEELIVNKEPSLNAVHDNAPPPVLFTLKVSVLVSDAFITPKSTNSVETSAIGYEGGSAIEISSNVDC